MIENIDNPEDINPNNLLKVILSADDRFDTADKINNYEKTLCEYISLYPKELEKAKSKSER